MAMTDEIYRMGVIGQFSLTFEQMWKTLQEVMRAHAINEAENGSPREILKAGYKFSFLDNEEVWLQMLKDRNSAMHIYDEEAFVGVLNRVYDSYIDTFDRFAVKIRVKIQEIESEST